DVLRTATPPGDQLTGSLPTLSKYDIVILPCDDEGQKPPASLENLVDYTGKGGRLFLTDWGYSWLRDGAMGTFQRTVTWKPRAILQGTDFVPLIDRSFPKGMVFGQWLVAVGAIRAMAPGLPVHDPYYGASN